MHIALLVSYLRALFEIAVKVWRAPNRLRQWKTLSKSEHFVLTLTAWVTMLLLKGLLSAYLM